MKFTRSTCSPPPPWLALTASGAAFAAGNHAGGHGHGKEEKQPSETRRRRQGQSHNHHRHERHHALHARRTFRSSRAKPFASLSRTSAQVKHELSWAPRRNSRSIWRQMKKFPDMEHDEPGKVTLQPGKQGEIVWQFTKAGGVNFACLIPRPLRRRHEGHSFRSARSNTPP
jgi:uncharacterized cupredoxin-like copper-binding protein